VALDIVRTSIANLASRITAKLDQSRSFISIIELDYPNDQASTNNPFIFQYFPEQISVSKQINRSNKDIPGASLPLYQWNSSGERLISFTATFTCDIDLLAKGASERKALTQRAIAQGAADRNVDIRDAVTYLNRFLLPKYEGQNPLGSQLTRAPRKLLLIIPGSGISQAGGGVTSGGVVPAGGGENYTFGGDGVACIMTQCETTYDSFFPSGLPRIATTQLAFAQIAQLNGGVEFPYVTEAMDAAVRAPVTSYKILRRSGTR